MIGGRYWSTGIMVCPSDGQWLAQLAFYDDGFATVGATEGMLRTRYFGADLSRQIDLLVQDAQQLGIEFRAPTLYWPGDGEDPKVPPTVGWKELLRKECERIGWRSCY